MKQVLRKIIPLFFMILTAGGLLTALYPFVSKWYNQSKALQAIESWQQEIDSLSDEQLEEQKEIARAFNENLLNTGIQWRMAEESALEDGDFTNHVIGTIEIPRIDLRLPIYEGIDEQSLSQGAGHLPGSSYPLNQKGTLSVITGHTGLPGARLFSDLDQLETGDRVLIHMLNETQAFEITNRQIVLPEDTDVLQILPDKEQLALITCTPYGVNSHRLILTADKTRWKPAANVQQLQSEEVKRTWRIEDYTALLIFALTLGAILFRIFKTVKEKRNAKHTE